MKNKKSKDQFIIEKLEQRLLLSADFVPVPFDGEEPGKNVFDDPSVMETDLLPNANEFNNIVSEEHQRHELIFIDAGVSDYQQLVDTLQAERDGTRQIEIVVLSSNRDGIEEISEILTGYKDLDAVHIVSHGENGAAQLGDAFLNLDNVDDYAGAINGWQEALNSKADILFYGCDLASGEDGRALIDTLTFLTGADVAASDDITGSAGLGGDWELEYASGQIETTVVLNDFLKHTWTSTLAANTAPTFITGGGQDGIVTTDLTSGSDYGQSITVQSDGKILAAGYGFTGSDEDFTLSRYNSDGSLDTSFGGGDGIVITAISPYNDQACSITLQSDGKILLGGRSYNGSRYDFALVRYNSDGSLDTSFGGGDGIVTTDIASSHDYAYSMTLQSDGKILLGGYNWSGTDYDFALARYNSDGTLDTSFGGGDGIVITDINSDADIAYGITVQSDGKILAGGYTSNGSNYDFALTRYNSDGSLDTSFGGGDGIVTTAIGLTQDYAYNITLQSDGKIFLAGYTWNGSDFDFALIRYNSDGTLDTSFGGGNGVVTTDIASGSDRASSVTVQSDGKILLGGRSDNGSDDDLALVRYNSDGTLDTSFGGGDGIVTTDIASGDDYAKNITVQSDGKILLAGYSDSGGDTEFLLIRYNTDGSLDSSFGSINSLNGTPAFTEGGAAVILDADVDVSDSELDALNSGLGDYDGANLTLVRNGGVSAEDTFSFTDGSGITLVGGNLLKNSQIIASFDITTTAGQLVITFTNANGETPTSVDVDNILRQITYANSSDAPPATAQIDWSFDDGNTGAQGTGGALTATGSTTVTITPVNDAPAFIIGGEQDGIVTTDLTSGSDYGQSITVQSDGKILAAGYGSNGSDEDFTLSRYNSDGSLDTSFGGGDGIVITDIDSNDDRAYSITLQSDGKIILSGSTWNGSDFDFVLIRYNSDGTIDTSFGGGDGIVTTDIASNNETATSITVQSDGKILLGGDTGSGINYDFVLTRYNSDGTLDTSFGGGDGIVTTAFGLGNNYGQSVTVQSDGKILLGGHTWNGSDFDLVLIRYNSDGSLDTSFGGGDGIVTTDIDSNSDFAYSVALQSDGKILLGGGTWNGTDEDFVLIRYNSDGSLDTSFGGGDGIVTTDIASGNDYAFSVALQSDGKILLGGRSNNGSDEDFALIRYNSDGSLDTSFGGGDGIVTTDIASGDDYAKNITVQSDGKILVCGYNDSGGDTEFTLVRYNSDGTLDTSFDSINSLNGTPAFTEGGAAVILDADVDVSDSELDALNSGLGDYDGANLTLVRNGGVSAEDVLLSFTDGSGITLVGGNLIKNSQIIASFDITTTTRSVGNYLYQCKWRDTNIRRCR